MNVLEKAVEVKRVPSLAELEAGLQCEFKKAKDMNSFAFHIHGKEAKALCGAETIFLGTKTVTVKGVLLSLPHQNGGWFWCADCGAAFTGEPKSVFTDALTSRGRVPQHH